MVTMTKSDAKKLVTEPSCHVHKTMSAIGLWFRVKVRVSARVLVSASVYGSAVEHVNRNH